MTQIVLPRGSGENRDRMLMEFADRLQEIQEGIGFRVSSRGWCYQLEGFGLISKAEFGKVETLINECRARGYVPIDFTAEEEGRKFSGIEIPNDETPAERIAQFARAMERCEYSYTPDWWSSMLQRAEYARRFKEAEERGLKCVLLYCGDHDPDGLRISQKIKKNLNDLKDIIWEDRTGGYDPEDLIVDRFGLNYNFILANNLSWIDNSEDTAPIGVPKLITGSGKNLADPGHKNFHMNYIQDYIKNFGVRKCEANALVIRPEQGRQLCQAAIEQYLGDDAIQRFERKALERDQWFNKVRSTIKVGDLTLGDTVKIIQKGLEDFDNQEG